jgi:DNA replication and repair protein RecF
MRLSQGQLLKEQTGKNCVYLIDDLSSELDSNSQQLLLSLIRKLDSQVFITNINKQLELPNFKDVLYINIEDLTNS